LYLSLLILEALSVSVRGQDIHFIFYLRRCPSDDVGECHAEEFIRFIRYPMR